MTTTTVGAHDRAGLGRTLKVVRLQYINRQTFFWIPLMVLAAAVVISVLVYVILPAEANDVAKYGGGAQAPMWYFLVVGIQALTLTFPFSQALSLSRKEFYAGSLLACALASAVLAALLIALGFVEQATTGYGVNGYVAYNPWVWEHGWAAAWFAYFLMSLLAFTLGFVFAVVYKRFGQVALTAVLIGLGLLLLGSLYLVTQMQWWAEVGRWFVSTGAFGLSLWLVPVYLVLTLLGYAVLRRAVVA